MEGAPIVKFFIPSGVYAFITDVIVIVGGMRMGGFNCIDASIVVELVDIARASVIKGL